VKETIELTKAFIESAIRENSLNKIKFNDCDPIELLKFLMKEQGLKQKDLVDILNLTKGQVSKMLKYDKGLSKATIKKLADYFKLPQEAFNRPYTLEN
jgi:HTH-type transcriptional regulator / antitoxin HigA